MHETIQLLMGAEADSRCQAEYGRRSEVRVNSRNGYRDRSLDTRVGTLDLKVPKLRSGSYYPAWLLEPRKRSEKALIQVVCEAWVEGVSTRKMDRLVKSLGIDGISRSTVSEMAKSLDERVHEFLSRPLDRGSYRYVWLDGTSLKRRECESVESVSAVIATGVNRDGCRELLGMDVFTMESETSWTEFIPLVLEVQLGSGFNGVTDCPQPGHEWVPSVGTKDRHFPQSRKVATVTTPR